MTRKDYQLIAEVLKTSIRYDPARRAVVALQFVYALRPTNPNFDESAFLRACELD